MNLDNLATAQDFYAFFDAIPEERWCTNEYTLGEAHCARGHLGGHYECTQRLSNLLTVLKCREFGMPTTIATINDGRDPNYQQPTPKQRILAALKDVMAINSRAI